MRNVVDGDHLYSPGVPGQARVVHQLWADGLDTPGTVLSRALRVLDNEVVGGVHHHDDLPPLLLKDSAGVADEGVEAGQAEGSLHPGVADD